MHVSSPGHFICSRVITCVFLLSDCAAQAQHRGYMLKLHVCNLRAPWCKRVSKKMLAAWVMNTKRYETNKLVQKIMFFYGF